MSKYKVGLISLGCDKNRIDSEIILGKLYEKYEIVNEPNSANIIIVNTCGFIEEAKQEAINTILEMSQYKNGNCKLLIATGCLTQRYGKELLELIPELDLIYGVNDYDSLLKGIDEFLTTNEKKDYCNYSNYSINEGERILTTPSHTAYLRVAEGCSNYCSYCAIPYIRGQYRSRKLEDIIQEANELAKKGVKEIILVAQDTTKYGVDIYGDNKIHQLIKEISNIDSIHWIRILYCYPEEIKENLIDEMAINPKVCHYIDLPLQHISNNVLKNMRRKSKKEDILKTINYIRTKMPDVVLRTSIITGFPGETEEDFCELKDFIKNVKIDKLGVFKYSQEEGTKAALMDNQIVEEVKEERYRELMLEQQKVSIEKNNNKIGKIYEVLVEGTKDDYWYGRSYEMAPEIDGAVWFKCDKILDVGNFIKIKVTEALEYDLIGVVCDESCK
ncbi:30S ribosomal protein S12 methylthiotransferase RimO [Haloimpatiens lingqiaonensis]|uniref:30S ribosomal protein S12 methylthiotransferase RimO n=1 Tax=Haloimpatiens lingqiaonensis TaxID=1380675 RepID=UPI0010FE5AE4|nr:30S ribosomal protein S12 methylthiotransferase RimO [Haloimpatiens lingqiaonensis]